MKYNIEMLTFIVFLLIISVEGQTVNRETNTPKCILPEHPSHGLWSLVAGTNSPYVSPGFEVPLGTALSIQCQTGYKINGPSFIICTDNVWSSEIGRCQGECPSLLSTPTTKVTCVSPMNRTEVENCTDPVGGSIAKLTCAQFYENAEIEKDPLFECRNGNWSRPIPQCAPVCGVKSVSAQPLISGGTVAKSTDYPWHVGIYQIVNGDTENPINICGGTLINERVILSATFCIQNPDLTSKPPSSLLVAVGKAHVKLNDPRDRHAQISKVQTGYKWSGYESGEKSNNIITVLILTTQKPFVLSKFVLPICIDYTLSYEKLFTQGNVNGTVVGWGFTEEYTVNVADELKELHVPFIPNEECAKSLPKGFDALITDEILCAGYINQSKAILNGDTGSGLVIRGSDGKYYLMGFSFLCLPVAGKIDQCSSQQVGLYTRITPRTANYLYEIERLITPGVSTTFFDHNRGKLPITHPVKVISESNQLCGLKSTKTQTLIIGGTNTTKGDYPWQIAIYDITKQKQLICGGSLIHQRIILTAAHCITNQASSRLNPKERYMLAAGKYYRDYDDARDTHVQFSPVKEMFIPPQYEGDKQNYIGDIAILVSEEKFILSKYIQPVCIDWDQKYEHGLTNSATRGFVSGWGSTSQSGEASEVLKDLEVPYVDRVKCKKELPIDYDIYLTFDKICSGYLNKSISVCRGDSGGGLVFRVPGTNHFYIAGIVSLSPRAPTAEEGCDQQQYSLYTRVSHYITSFILAKVRLFL